MPATTNKLHTIVDDLRKQIVAGRYVPGSRLPTRTRLQDRYQVSPTTLQRVFDRLINDGFVETRGKAGTFVSELPPHLSHYAVLLHGSETQSRLYRVLANQANLRSRDGRQVACYFGIDEHQDSPDYRRLTADVRAHRVAGMVFSTHPFEFVGAPLLTLPGIPRCALMSIREYPNVSAVYVDLESFVRRGLEFLAKRGRGRIAWLVHRAPVPSLEHLIPTLLEQHGMRSREAWFQYVTQEHPVGIRQAARLLFDGPPEYRPDGLIIMDDNLIEEATRGIAEAGIMPDDLDIVGCCNFPEPPPSSLPITQLGFDISALLDRCFANIDLERQGRVDEVEPLYLFPAVFANELTTNKLEY